MIYFLHMLRRMLASLLAIALFGTPQGGFAYEPPVLRFGIEPRTLDELKRLESKFASDLVDLEKRIAADVYGFISAFDDLVDKQLANVQCTAAGIPGDIFDQFKKTLNLAVIPLEDLASDWNAVNMGLRFNNEPTAFANAYADFIYRAELTYCKVSLDPKKGPRSAPARQAKYYEGLALKRYRTWERLQESRACTTVSGCYDSLKREVTALLQEPVHQRDLITAKVRIADGVIQTAQYGSFRVLAEPKTLSFLSRNNLTGFDSTDYEARMAELFEIGDAIAVSFSDREFPMCLDRLQSIKHISRGGLLRQKTDDVRQCGGIGIKTMPPGRTPAVAEFQLKYQPLRFLAVLSQHDDCDSTMPGAWTEVLIDGKGTAFRVHQRNSQSYTIDVAIPKGARILTLMSTPIDDGQCTGATWFEARVE